MLCGVWCVLFVHSLVFVVCCLLFVVRGLSFVVACRLLLLCWLSLCAGCCFWCGSLFVARCSLSVVLLCVDCPLFCRSLWIVVRGALFFVACFLVVGWWLCVLRCWLLVSDCRFVLVVGCVLFVVRCLLLVVGCWLLIAFLNYCCCLFVACRLWSLFAC